MTQPWDALTSVGGIGEAWTYSTSMRVMASAVGEASTGEVAAGVDCEGAKAGPRTEEAQVGGAPASEDKDVDTMGQV